jgi:5'-3' exonuclease
MMQTLMGDVCDNYKGLPRLGCPIKAGELIDQFNMAGPVPGRALGGDHLPFSSRRASRPMTA